METEALQQLAELIRLKNEADAKIAALIGRPAQIGHAGVYIASHVFGIALEASASHKGSDGRFTGGPLAGCTVNVKWYAKHDGLMDLNLDWLPDYFLVLAGPRTAPGSSRGAVRPWAIEFVYLFDAPQLADSLEVRGVKRGIASSITRVTWDEAQIYPMPHSSKLRLTDEQRSQLALFHHQGGAVPCSAMRSRRLS